VEERENQTKKREKLCFSLGLIFDSEDGGSMYLRNICEFSLSNTSQLDVGTLLKDCTTT
jgi:hypothetical protein